MLTATDLDTLTVLNDIRERLLALTPQHLDWAERSLKVPTPQEKSLGVVHSPAARSLYALHAMLRAESSTAMACATSEIDEVVADERKRSAAVLSQIADAACSLFWSQAKADLGIYVGGCFHLRRGFVVTDCQAANSVPSSIARMLGLSGWEGH